MANYSEINDILESTAANLSLQYEISDGFEVLKQSQNFEANKIIILKDVSSRTSANAIQGNINTGTPYVLWFIKNYEKDDNQAQLDVLHNELKVSLDSYMFNLNSNLSLKAENIGTYNTEGSKLTVNYFYGIQVTFTLDTKCNL